MAGTGKSTIALTVAREQYEHHHLGASFFFSRGGGGRSSARSFPATIAAQLREFSPELKKCINDAAAVNPRIRTLMLYDQWKKLVIEPLSHMRNRSFPSPLLLVIDALDECDDGALYGETAFSALVQCLKDITTIKGVEVRAFVTSRPDGAIKLGFQRILNKEFQGFALHNIERWIVDEDLTTFYKTRLTDAAVELNRADLKCSDEAIKHLVEKSHGLFIYAALVCKYVCAGGVTAHYKLSDLLAAGNNSVKAEIGLDRLYTTVLESSFATIIDSDDRVAALGLFHRVIGSVVILFDVMTAPDLAMLLGEPEGQVLTVLSCQESVIDVTKHNGPIRLVHPSFRDFLLDSTRCLQSDFLVDTKEEHGRLFRCCVQLMKDHLRRNMCMSSQPAINPRDHISKSDMRKNIPIAVQYASCYWIHHLRRSAIDPTEDGDILEFFQYRFIYWLEALALIARLSEGALMMDILAEMVSVSHSKVLIRKYEGDVNLSQIPNTNTTPRSSQNRLTRKLMDKLKMTEKPAKPPKPHKDTPTPLHLVLMDAKRFLRSHISTIEDAPLQLYSSAILFSPTSCITRQRYHHEIQGWTLPNPGLSEVWAQHIQRFDCEGPAKDVVFSQDGRLFAAAFSTGFVYVWEATTFTQAKKLDANAEAIVSVVFSPDGCLVAIVDGVGIISLWDLTTSSRLPFRGEPGKVLEVAFLSNGNLVASYLPVIYIWDVDTGMKLHTLRYSDFEHLPIGRKLSIDCTIIDFCAKPTRIEIRDMMTGTIRRSFECPGLLRDKRKAVQVSPDGNLVAFECHHAPDNCALLNIKTGETRFWRSRLPYSNNDCLRFAFSPDSKLIAVASVPDIEIFQVATWKILQCLQIPEGLASSITFSPSGNILASGCEFGSIVLWDVRTFEESRKSQNQNSYPRGRATSVDVNGLAVTSDHGEIFFWDTEAQRCRAMKDQEDRSNNSGIALSPGGKLLASTQADGKTYLWDTTTGARRHVLKMRTEELEWNSALQFSPNGKLLATATWPEVVTIWDTTTGKKQHDIVFREQDTGSSHHKASPIVFSSDNNLIAFACASHTIIYMWDLRKNIAIPKIEFRCSHRKLRRVIVYDQIIALAFSPDGKRLASISSGDGLCLWDTATGKRLWYHDSPSLPGGPLVFSPNAELIACQESSSIKLLDVKSGTLQHDIHTPCHIDHFFFSGAGLTTNRGSLPLTTDDSQAIFVSEDWIMVGGQRNVYIPPDYRRLFAFVSGDAIVFFDSSNQPQTVRYIRP
ncbi:unnamed protein product [Penicillium salamii]|uniref:Nephrocystin 3-like N-terminal domain-containing protein n=1 Tax=Penicillium salamii TaxID=1612424 RepID=A0A9W4NHY1_9EURO|nr:unnamed protein product [Penicillium salamii]CAG8171611.1 unnamed protein product [Penicillium salamii]CAG8227026.1 unnamed protein product [Penicillium salamii]CAG8320665.1 unnamed protein product [Penicillium salamii]CAG8372007.1 unnamed protein product [Penicillium salamii]